MKIRKILGLIYGCLEEIDRVVYSTLADILACVLGSLFTSRFNSRSGSKVRGESIGGKGFYLKGN